MPDSCVELDAPEDRLERSEGLLAYELGTGVDAACDVESLPPALRVISDESTLSCATALALVSEELRTCSPYSAVSEEFGPCSSSFDVLLSASAFDEDEDEPASAEWKDPSDDIALCPCTSDVALDFRTGSTTRSEVPLSDSVLVEPGSVCLLDTLDNDADEDEDDPSADEL